MRPVLILQHNEDVTTGYLGDVLDERGVPTETRPLYDGATVPGHEPWSGIVVLGGSMGAYDEADHPWLGDEKRLVRNAAAAGLSVLGICLGCQLVADALGGKAYLAASPEAFFATVELEPSGAADPVVGALTGRVLSLHRDTWDLPPGATLLARSERHPHAFRLDSAVGIQSHPEASAEIVADWMANHDVEPMLQANGLEGDNLLAALQAARSDSEAMARRLFGAWVDEIDGVRES